ncbi:hypothetical protein GCM10017559_82510 [Streptosporangium longisporum]|uniref:Transposase IS200-like domain-containing protein n=1 Tax=Streptosporangium longisporum TaxID=46187 RepID=A0ABP6LJ71_9ACTN
MNVPPKITLSKLVNSIKGVSSRRMPQEFPEPARHCYRANKLWPGSCFAGSVGRTTQRPEPVHRVTNRPSQGTLGPGGPPARAYIPA